MNEYTDTCTQCGREYDPDQEGHTHDPECECWYCDTLHDEYDPDIGPVIRDYVSEHGALYFCCYECESDWIREET